MTNKLLQRFTDVLAQRHDLLADPAQARVKLHFFFLQEPIIHDVSQFGVQAQALIQHAKRLYREGTVSPPYTIIKIEKIFELFAKLDQDLTQPPSEWQASWQYLQQQFSLSKENLNRLQTVLLASYRRLVFSFAEFSPYGNKSTLLDECRIQDFLQRVNRYYPTLSPSEAYESILKELNENLAIDLPLDLQSLSRYLNTKNTRGYLRKLEEITSRNTMEFLGESALNKLYAELMNDHEFVKQLPDLAKQSKTLRHQLKIIRSNHH